MATTDANKAPAAPNYAFWALNAALAAAFAGTVGIPQFAEVGVALSLVLGTMASVAALSRQLPLQNVLLAAGIAAALGTLAHALSAIPNLSVPFGPVLFHPEAGPKLFGLVPWIIPFLWIVAVFSARGTARLILRPWRKIKNYGFWLIGITAALAVAFDFALEPYACHVRHYWLWQPTKITVTWQGATPLNFLGWAFVSLLVLAFASPALIRKQPGNAKKIDLHPFLLWLGALGLFAAGAAGAHLWTAVGVDAAIAAVTAWFAVRGARW